MPILALACLFLLRYVYSCLGRLPVFASACLFLPREAACFCLGMPILASGGCLFLSRSASRQRHSRPGTSPNPAIHMEESIYNLIPKEYVPPQKESLYKSQYSSYIPPTGSTFVNHTTAIPDSRGNLTNHLNLSTD